MHIKEEQLKVNSARNSVHLITLNVNVNCGLQTLRIRQVLNST